MTDCERWRQTRLHQYRHRISNVNNLSSQNPVDCPDLKVCRLRMLPQSANSRKAFPPSSPPPRTPENPHCVRRQCFLPSAPQQAARSLSRRIRSLFSTISSGRTTCRIWFTQPNSVIHALDVLLRIWLGRARLLPSRFRVHGSAGASPSQRCDLAALLCILGFLVHSTSWAQAPPRQSLRPLGPTSAVAGWPDFTNTPPLAPATGDTVYTARATGSLALPSAAVAPQVDGELFEPAETVAQIGDQYILKGELLGDANLILSMPFSQLENAPPAEREQIRRQLLEMRDHYAMQLLDPAIERKIKYLEFLRSLPTRVGSEETRRATQEDPIAGR